MKKNLLILLVLFLTTHVRAQYLDKIVFADTLSEKRHGISPFGVNFTEVYTNSNGIKARRFLPYNSNPYSGTYPGMYGGEISFVVKVDSTRQNYFTTKFSGSELNGGRILLTVEDQEVGTRHGGDEDLFLRKIEVPLKEGGFFYRTAPIPMSLTLHKSTVVIRMRSVGHLNEYCNNPFSCYQQTMSSPSIGMITGFTHTDPGFDFGSEEQHGTPSTYTTSPSGTVASMAQIRSTVVARANGKVNAILNGPNYIATYANNNYNEIEDLAIAYTRPAITAAYRNPQVIAKIRNLVDNLVINSNNGIQTAGACWGGAFGRPAYAVHLIYSQLTGLDDIVDLGGGPGLTRRQQWVSIFLASFTSGATFRRPLANQEMEGATSVYGAALGLARLDPVKYSGYRALGLRLLLEAGGVEEYTGSMIFNSGQPPVLGNPLTSGKGKGFYFVTEYGTTKEIGYASTDCYGGQADHLTMMYYMTMTDSTITAYGAGNGEKRLLEKATLHAKAQAAFTYAGVVNGKKAIIAESDLCVRIQHYGHPYYGGPLVASATLDPVLLGYVYQSINEGYFSPDGVDPKETICYYLPESLDAVSLHPSSIKMPSTPGQDDYVTFDTDNVVISIKHGEERLFVTFNSRASYINNIVRIHHVNELYDRKVELRPYQNEFRPAGTVIRPGSLYGYNYVAPDNPLNAYGGMVMQQAASEFSSGYIDGKSYGDFHVARYGKYLIAMNSTADVSKTISFPIDMVGKLAHRIDNHSNVTIPSSASVPPNSVFVYYVDGLSLLDGTILAGATPSLMPSKATLADSVSKYRAFINTQNISNVSIAQVSGKYNLFLFRPFVHDLVNADYTLQDSMATQEQVNQALVNVVKSYKDLTEKKYSYSTNTLVDGTYKIKIPNLDSVYTVGTTNLLTFKKASAPINNQRFMITKESNGRYKIAPVSAPPTGYQAYINESAAIGKNAYDATWNTMNIYSNGNYHAIQKAQRAGNGYWFLSGNTISTQGGTANSAIPLSFPFELKLDIFANLDQKLELAIRLRDTTQTTITQELGKFPPASKQALSDSISYAQVKYDSLKTISETEGMAAMLQKAITSYRQSMFYQSNKLPDGIYFVKPRGKDLYWTKNATNVPMFEAKRTDSTVQRWQIVKQSNGRYKITSLSPPASYLNYINEAAAFGQNNFDQTWNTMNIYRDATAYAVQRAQKAGNGYWSVSGTKILASANLTDAFPYDFLFDFFPSPDPQVINLANLGAMEFSHQPRSIQASATSGLQVQFSSSDTTIAKIIDGKVLARKAGMVTITASQPGNGFFSPALPVTDTLKIFRKKQVLDFLPFPVKQLGDSDVVLTASSSSGLPVTFTSSDSTIALVKGGIVKLLKAGQVTLKAVQVGNDEYDPADTVQVLLIKGYSLKVQLSNGDNDALNNLIKPHLKIINPLAEDIDLKELTMRYYFTPENFAGINTGIDYAAMGNGKVKMAYVPLTAPAEGALGYIEYSFMPDAGMLSPNGSGVIQSWAANKDWSILDENDDYSFQNTNNFQENVRIALYRNGKLIFGSEPVNVVTELKVVNRYQNSNSSTTSNSMAGTLLIENTGNVPVQIEELKVRYYFTNEGNAEPRFYLDYAKMGNSTISAAFAAVPNPLQRADHYLEIGFSSGILYPKSNTGNIQYRVSKTDWSAFDETNDYSWIKKGSLEENSKMTMYYKGQLIYGTPPSGITPLAIHKVDNSMASSLAGRAGEATVLYPNPMKGSVFHIKTKSDLLDKDIRVRVRDAYGRIIFDKRLGKNLTGDIEIQLGTILDLGLYIVQLNDLPSMKLYVGN